MEVVWEGEPMRARAIVAALQPSTGWSDRTVKSLLGRLVKKGALGFEVEGKRYRYHARVSREECVAAESRTFLERVFGGSTSPLLAHFLRDAELSPEEVARLRALLEEKEEDTP